MDYQRIELRTVAGKRKYDAAAMWPVRSDVFARGIGDDLFPRQRTGRREHHQRNLGAEDEGQASADAIVRPFGARHTRSSSRARAGS